MRIDVHCHVHTRAQLGEPFLKEFVYHAPCWWDQSKMWNTDYLGIDSPGVPNLIEDMDASGVDKAVLLGSAMQNYRTFTPPDYLAGLVKEHPDRLIGFCAVDPVSNVGGTQQLEEAILKYGLRGLKVYPGYTGVPANDSRFIELYKKAEQLRIPVTIHMGFCGHHVAMLEYQRPTLLDQVAGVFPDLKLIVAHLGWQWANETIFLMLRHKNVYADLASYPAFVPYGHFVNTMSWIKKVGLIERVMWGTDFPLTGHKVDLAPYEKLPSYCKRHEIDPVITEADLDLVLGNNAAKLLL